MSIENKSTAPQVSVLAEISARLAASTPEQFIVPDVARPKEASFVCMASDDIKRLFTLRSNLVNEMDNLIKSDLRASLDALTEISTRNLHDEMVDGLKTLGSRALELKKELFGRRCAMQRIDRLCEIVDSVMWLEIRRQHPDLLDRPTIGIFSDWSLCWFSDDPHEKMLEMSADIDFLASLGQRPRKDLN